MKKFIVFTLFAITIVVANAKILRPQQAEVFVDGKSQAILTNVSEFPVFDASFNKQNNTVVIKSSAGTLVLYKKESTYFYKGVWKNITISVNAILDFYNNVSRVYYTEKQGNKEIVTIYK
mgnify:CR=1 FL=1